jgi:hypothetical protein
MDMETLLRRIGLRLKDLCITEAAAARAATGSPDTIRNWRRRQMAGHKPGASTRTIEALAVVLGVDSSWLMGDGPEIVDPAEAAEKQSLRDQLNEIFDNLDASMKPVALDLVSALRPVKPRRRNATPPKKAAE